MRTGMAPTPAYRRFRIFIALLTTVGGLTSCKIIPATTDVVVIHYRQVLNTRNIQPDKNQNYRYFVSQGWLFTVYQITKIENPSKNKATFYFKLDKLYATYDSEPLSPNNVAPELATYFDAPPGAVVRPGVTEDRVGFFIIDFVNASPQIEKNNYASSLLAYRSDPGEHVLLAREPALYPEPWMPSMPPDSAGVFWRNTTGSQEFGWLIQCNRKGYVEAEPAPAHPRYNCYPH